MKITFAFIFSVITLLSVSGQGALCIEKACGLFSEKDSPSCKEVKSNQLNDQENQDEDQPTQGVADSHFCHLGHCDFALNSFLTFNFLIPSAGVYSDVSLYVTFDFHSGLFRPPRV